MFDPSLPQAGTEIDAVQMRSQLNGLKALIDAIVTLTAAQIDGVNTVNPGDPASVIVSVIGNTLHFTFDIPRGQEGLPGSNGSDGAQGVPGIQGQQGAQGPPFAQAVVDAVTTLNPGDPATVTVSFDGVNVHFSYGIPRGTNGSNGSNGSDGAQGPQGPPFAQAVIDSVNTLPPGTPATVGVSFDGSNVHFVFSIPEGASGGEGPQGDQGPPGEVTNAALAGAISSTSSNSNAVTTLDTPFVNDPPTLADMEVMRVKMNELITALRR
jgi:hypothetical protein